MDSNPNDISTFEKEVLNPTTAAQGAANTTEAGGPGGRFTPPPPQMHQQGERPAYVPPPAPEFQAPDAPPPGAPGQPDDDEEEEERPRVSKGYEDKVIKGLVKGYDNLKANIVSFIALDDDYAQFKMEEETTEDAIVCLDPFKDWIIDKCPAVLPIIMVLGGDLVVQGRKAAKVRKTNKANRQAAEQPEILRKVNINDRELERGNFQINPTTGYYAYPRSGGEYLKPNDPDYAQKRERPNIADLEKILAVKKNRNKTALKRAFNFTDADFGKYGITD